MYLIFTVLCSGCVLLCLGDDDGFATTSYDYKKSAPHRWQLNNEDSTELNIKRNNIADTTHFPDTLESPDERGEEPESSEFNSDALKSFLQTYAKKFKKPTQSNDRFSEETEEEIASSELPKLESISSSEKGNVPQTADKSKSWDLMSIRKTSNPFDHKTGWVSLEAVPWSVSKVSKWEGKPDIKPHPNDQEIPKIPIHHQMYPKPDYQQQENDNFARPEAFYKPKPNYNTYKPQYNDFPPDPNENEEHYYRPPTRPNYSQPPFQKYPQNSFPQQLETESEYDQRPPVRKYTTQKPFKNRFENYQNGGPGHSHYGDLITDGKPPNFPSYNDYYNRRLTASLDDHPPQHPENGNVLPPLEDSNVNMTTSHGGLLQVESTFQSVEEAQKQHAEKEKLKRRKATTALPPTTKKPWRIWRKKFQPTATTDGYIHSNEQTETVQNFPKTVAIASNPAGHDSAAVLAAVGAGMIPATMAMLVPMAMGGRRRRRSTKKLVYSFPLFNH
ncbi:uncharacterized protein LOC108732888 [Agrilus planipennis]|uniref:Uncharacterized protein LOC108732888 n=1 Tax=Agrilus planipennis TaxID=224129 RepID=A0A1W4W5I9_AGRPL|nr:uncharacterized protein LOC108732888 [Agrilus planipennis]